MSLLRFDRNITRKFEGNSLGSYCCASHIIIAKEMRWYNDLITHTSFVHSISLALDRSFTHSLLLSHSLHHTHSLPLSLYLDIHFPIVCTMTKQQKYLHIDCKTSDVQSSLHFCELVFVLLDFVCIRYIGWHSAGAFVNQCLVYLNEWCVIFQGSTNRFLFKRFVRHWIHTTTTFLDAI